MTTIQNVLSAYAVPLQIWMSPEARKCSAEAVIDQLGGAAKIQINPLAVLNELNGPAVVLIAASELSNQELKALTERAHPGRAVLIGGTSDRDVLMQGINEWGVVRVVSADASGDEIVAAVRAAGDHLKREVALESAIEDLDIETTMLDSAIDHLGSGQTAAVERAEGHASNALSDGLTNALNREASIVRELVSEFPELTRAVKGIDALTVLLQQTGDRAIERAAGLEHADEDLDAMLQGFCQIWEAQHNTPLPGHIGTGAKTSIDPLDFAVLLMHLCEERTDSHPVRFDAHRSGESAVIDIDFSGPTSFTSLEVPDGIEVQTNPNDSSKIRLTITMTEPHHG